MTEILICVDDVSSCWPEKKNTARHYSKNGTFQIDARSHAVGRAMCRTSTAQERIMSIGTIILIILVIALLGGFSGVGGGPFYGTGYYGGGGLGLVIVILLILLLLGRL